jgi:hypothetical protein
MWDKAGMLKTPGIKVFCKKVKREERIMQKISRSNQESIAET